MAPRNTLLVALVLALVAAALLHLATVLPRLATIKEFSSYSPPEPEPGPKCPADCGGYFLRLDSGGVQEADIVIRGEVGHVYWGKIGRYGTTLLAERFNPPACVGRQWC